LYLVTDYRFIFDNNCEKAAEFFATEAPRIQRQLEQRGFKTKTERV
jgi:hypothetical protein